MFAKYFALILLLSSCGGGSTPQSTEVEPGNKSLEQILKDAVDTNIDGIFLYVEQTGKEPIAKAEGVQMKTPNVVANPEALFKIASISKLYIAVVATKLMTLNVINRKDTLAAWLPEYQNQIQNSQTITLDLLVQHRSGIPDFDSQNGFSWEDEHTDIDKTLSFALNLPADFSPNERYEYSNTNFLLLRKILDKALGYSHREYIQSDILNVLQLSRTYNTFEEADKTNFSHGYWNNLDRYNQAFSIPGGSMISSTKDTATFLRALNTGNLLTEQEKTLYSELYYFYHTGWLPGYQSQARYISDIDAAIVLFVNTTGGSSESASSNTFQEIVSYLRRNP